MARYLALHFLNLFLIACAFLSSTACQEQRSRRPSRYLFAEGYVGWVRIDYKVKDAPALPVEDGYYLLKFPSSGWIKTSSNIEYGTASDEYYYYSDNTRRRLESTGWGGGGMIWGGSIGSTQGADEPPYEYLFVGTEEEFKKYGDRNRDDNFHPKIGPVDKRSPETNVENNKEGRQR